MHSRPGLDLFCWLEGKAIFPAIGFYIAAGDSIDHHIGAEVKNVFSQSFRVGETVHSFQLISEGKGPLADRLHRFG